MSWGLSIIHSTSNDVLNLFPKYLIIWLDNYNNFQTFWVSFFGCMFHLSKGVLATMIFEHCQDSFDPKDLTNGFI